MSTATLELRCIDQLVDDAFIIPSYQRGYRWSSVEVRALLDELDELRQAKRREAGRCAALAERITARRWATSTACSPSSCCRARQATMGANAGSSSMASSG